MSLMLSHPGRGRRGLDGVERSVFDQASAGCVAGSLHHLGAVGAAGGIHLDGAT